MILMGFSFLPHRIRFVIAFLQRRANLSLDAKEQSCEKARFFLGKFQDSQDDEKTQLLWVARQTGAVE